jgi:hypothetical protein
MVACAKIARLAYFRSRVLAVLCVALTLSLGASKVIAASESTHHELEITQAGSTAAIVYCSGDDRSCDLPDHDHDHVVPHLHTADTGVIGLPAGVSPISIQYRVAGSVNLATSLLVEGLKQQAPYRPPRTTCI